MVSVAAKINVLALFVNGLPSQRVVVTHIICPKSSSSVSFWESDSDSEKLTEEEQGLNRLRDLEPGLKGRDHNGTHYINEGSTCKGYS